MVDIVSPEIRSRMMASIGSKNTKPELLVRKLLFSLGFRYRIHDKRLPGKPDIVLPKYGAVIYVNSCFWHMHNCPDFKMPKSNTEWWTEKLKKNKQRDMKNIKQLNELGWRVLVIWECAFDRKGVKTDRLISAVNQASKWLKKNKMLYMEIPELD